MSRLSHLIPMTMIAAFFASLLAAVPLHGHDIETVPYLPLIYEVRYPPAPVKGEGGYHLIYELHLANFSRREVTLRKIEVLGKGGTLIRAYEEERLTVCLTRPGKAPGSVNKAVLEAGAPAVLFVMLSFQGKADIPDIVSHRITATYLRGTDEKVTLRGEGGAVTVARTEPPLLGPPVRPGVWLAGNCAGDGPVGHRASLQPWNGKLVANERYAVDFMKFDPDFRLVRGDPSKNSNWACYGEDVIAVADGVVSHCRDGIVENTPLQGYAVPGTLESAGGNLVVVEIGRSLYAVYAHLKPDSLKVKTGDWVRRGQVLGLIGNSGISDAPHLHFHLVNAPDAFGGESLPFVFGRFERLGPFEQLDDSLNKVWSPKGDSARSDREMPLGDVVIRFPGR